MTPIREFRQSVIESKYTIGMIHRIVQRQSVMSKPLSSPKNVYVKSFFSKRCYFGQHKYRLCA